ncbi:MAG: hypothetical protein NVSMB12_12570 [Acidimicrobiales bacterium]
MTGWSVTLPHQKEWPWLAGVALVAAFDVIDWPVALLLGIGHTIVTNSRNQQLRELADGMDSAL